MSGKSIVKMTTMACRFLVALTLPAACELLRLEPFIVESWEPGLEEASAETPLATGVTFSIMPDRASAENAFTLTENGTKVSGDFMWTGCSMSFVPSCPLRPNSEYRLTVSADTRTSEGLSLDSPFEARFTTKSESIRPRIISTRPEHGGMMADVRDPVTLEFSERMDPVCFPERVSFAPSVRGTWTWSGSGCIAVFTPVEPWERRTEYEAVISADAPDCNGNEMGTKAAFKFTVGDDTIAPRLIGLDAIGESGDVISSLIPDSVMDETVTENHGWESAWKMRAIFSEPVSLQTVDAAIEFDVGISGGGLKRTGFSETIDIAMMQLPEWGERFAIRIGTGIEDASGNRSVDAVTYRFVFDGPRSRPPRFIGARIPMAPGAALPEDREMTSFAVDEPYQTIEMDSGPDGFPIDIPTRLSIECYFDVARGATIDSTSVMGSFRASATNGALDFYASAIEPGALEGTSPAEAWSGCTIVRIRGTMTNHVASGLFTIMFAPGLEDSSGNSTATAQRLAMQK